MAVMKTSGIISVWCLLLGSLPVLAGDTLSIEEFHRKAVEGDAEAQTSLGFCYDHGIFVEKDAARAIPWYRKAAEQGELIANSNPSRELANYPK